MPHCFAVAYSVKSGTSNGGLGDGAGGGEGEDGGGEGEGGGGEGEGGEGGGIGQAVWQTYFCLSEKDKWHRSTSRLQAAVDAGVFHQAVLVVG